MTLSRKSGVSYGAIKRFESKGEILLLSLIKISFASIAKERARNIALHVQTCVGKMLKEWL